MSIEQPFSVGEWEVHPRQHRITRNEETVALEPKVMQLLLRFAECPGKVVLHRELLADVWKDTVVTDEALFRAISSLRRALGDNARNPTFLETIPKAGYRLLAPVDFHFAQGDSIPTLSYRLPAPQAIAKRKHRNRSVLLVGGAVAIVAVTYIISGLVRADEGDGARPLLASAAVTTFFGFEIQPALSPDGKSVAFVWSGPDNGSINVYVQSLEAETPLQLTDDFFYEYSPSWSPDGTRIAFARSQEGVFVRPVIGGSERRVAEVGPGARPSLDWSPVDEQLVVSDTDSSGGAYRLYLVGLETGVRTPLTDPPAHSVGDKDPAFSPDGRRIAFIRSMDAADELHVIGAEGGVAYVRIAEGSKIEGVDWTADGQNLLFASDRGGTFELWQVGPDGGTPVRVMGGPDALRDPSISQSLVVYTRSQRDVNLWEVSADGGEPQIITGSSGYDGAPAFSADGSKMAFISDRSGSSAVYMQAEDRPPVPISTTVRAPENPAWSPNDEWIVFDALIDGNRDVYLAPTQGGPPTRLTDHTAVDAMPTFSADGDWVYYATRRTGAWGIRRVSVEQPSRDESVIAESAFRPHIAKNGALFFSQPGKSGVWSMDSGSLTQILSIPTQFESNGWTLDANTIWAGDRSDRRAPALRSFNLDGQPEGAALALPSNVRSIAVRGHQIVVERVDHSVFDIMLATR